MPEIKSIAVFCGSSKGKGDSYMDSATLLGEEMVRRNIKLVYGGGSVGLMGQIAATVAKGLGEEAVLGVITEDLAPREISGAPHGEVRVVPDMHTRKAVMAQNADAFIALPGGYGTLEEVMEMITWQQLGIHAKPVGFLDVDGLYTKLLQFFDDIVAAGFVSAPRRGIAQSDTDACKLIDKLIAYQAPDNIIKLAKEGKLDQARG